MSRSAPRSHPRQQGGCAAARDRHRPFTVAVVYTWSHAGRVRSEAALAILAGVNPIPASSGNTIRHRLNRGGDRRLDRALHAAVVTHMTHDLDTRATPNDTAQKDEPPRGSDAASSATSPDTSTEPLGFGPSRTRPAALPPPPTNELLAADSRSSVRTINWHCGVGNCQHVMVLR